MEFLSRGVWVGDARACVVLATRMAAIGTNDDKWYFTKEQIESTPSRRGGIPADKELSYRQQAATLIQDMGQRLSVYPSLKLIKLAGTIFTLPRQFGNKFTPSKSTYNCNESNITLFIT